NFGDGTTGSGVTTSHTYQTSGNYNVTLTVTDNDGLTDTYSAILAVLGQTSGDNQPGGGQPGTDNQPGGGTGIIISTNELIIGIVILVVIVIIVAFLISRRKTSGGPSGW
ncbi:MAG: PKD domain-containing protein, partial [Candidatus Hadarchaeales archaeon]